MKADEISGKNLFEVSVDGGSLYVSCFDCVEVKDRTTFDSYAMNGIDVTFWMEDDVDIEARINGMFDTLFNEVVKARDKNLVSVSELLKGV